MNKKYQSVHGIVLLRESSIFIPPPVVAAAKNEEKRQHKEINEKLLSYGYNAKPP